jgi:membrane protease YdiL (CAAX protease family)
MSLISLLALVGVLIYVLLTKLSLGLALALIGVLLFVLAIAVLQSYLHYEGKTPEEIDAELRRSEQLFNWILFVAFTIIVSISLIVVIFEL